ncbi:hypothetical protein Tco_1272060, partial [Tanacetum coccineum]
MSNKYSCKKHNINGDIVNLAYADAGCKAKAIVGGSTNSDTEGQQQVLRANVLQRLTQLDATCNSDTGDCQTDNELLMNYSCPHPLGLHGIYHTNIGNIKNATTKQTSTSSVCAPVAMTSTTAGPFVSFNPFGYAIPSVTENPPEKATILQTTSTSFDSAPVAITSTDLVGECHEIWVPDKLVAKAVDDNSTNKNDTDDEEDLYDDGSDCDYFDDDYQNDVDYPLGGGWIREDQDATKKFNDDSDETSHCADNHQNHNSRCLK